MYKRLITFLFFVSTQAHAQPTIHHLLPDLDGREYQRLLQNQPMDLQVSGVSDIIDFGQRNLEWLAHINSKRSDKLSFSTPENRKTYPVDAPSIYNEEIIRKRFDELLKELPVEMKRVLLDGQPFTDDAPIALNDYLRYGLLVDGVYQSASRWILLSPWIPYLSQNRVNDIRGYYHLQRMENLKENLAHYSALSPELKEKVTTGLLGICYNTEVSDANCKTKLERSVAQNNGDATAFYNMYLKRAESIHNKNYQIPREARRSDIMWRSEDQAQTATIPFLETDATVKTYLHNIEQEWQWGEWKLLLQFQNGSNIPYIEFTPGATPHVNTLGGNQIVMDANQPLTEWDSQWTIRHEFGHVLGFPDCYVEFYDSSLKAIVNYQLDVSNLMCSRKGKLKETHFLEMKRNYSL